MSSDFNVIKELVSVEMTSNCERMLMNEYNEFRSFMESLLKTKLVTGMVYRPIYNFLHKPEDFLISGEAGKLAFELYERLLNLGEGVVALKFVKALLGKRNNFMTVYNDGVYYNIEIGSIKKHCSDSDPHGTGVGKKVDGIAYSEETELFKIRIGSSNMRVLRHTGVLVSKDLQVFMKRHETFAKTLKYSVDESISLEANMKILSVAALATDAAETLTREFKFFPFILADHIDLKPDPSKDAVLIQIASNLTGISFKSSKRGAGWIPRATSTRLTLYGNDSVTMKQNNGTTMTAIMVSPEIELRNFDFEDFKYNKRLEHSEVVYFDSKNQQHKEVEMPDEVIREFGPMEWVKK